MKLFKRVTSMCLLAAILFGFLSGVTLPKTNAAGGTSNPVKDENGNAVVNLLENMNADFEQIPVIPNWTSMYGVSQSTDHLYDDGGLWSLELADHSSSEAIFTESGK